MKPKLLLHTCCAPCSAYVVQLLQEQFDVNAYFYDPNIHPKREYEKRLGEMRRWCSAIGLPLIKAPYEIHAWFALTRGHEKDPEKGDRCKICYRMRLEHAVIYAKEHGYAWFTTVLTISPHKDAVAINAMGCDLAQAHNIRFYEANFKKNDGFKKSVELSKHYGFYRQNWCGCIWSRNAYLRKRTHAA
ncbi:MAG: recombinase [Parcubacteria group bacterium CG11_big_fil_rev_8_21_14_0_20_48_46]|nr:MAG: recombinase [Parcubacteria group bacterium CG_4_8_14_3_um_filter_48_16]PIY77833.1 MAG: recombinase [Parcubacteria group bacterium CG_4_10_14_0_8_um_filter_48_154]PIZ78137.1 MAG: recombinase [bacterium CG_4_10_14_0_2_um_filter_48_144]PJC39626.1 MAG: recombinase [Parcubacteria group bacterium CG_4_9_14_0_2_um_filter_48_40]PJE52458.1 MAG: recombinase [Parcubacteria group bacterium CG11_big_fil_rev_8_21_14_0_20_48_46]